MAVPAENTISDIIKFAKNSQIQAALKIAQLDAFKGGALSPDYSGTLYIARKALEFMNNSNPANPTLRQVGEFTFALCRGFGPLVPPATISISNPSNASVNVGQTAIFCVTVSVSTGAPYTIQWFRNGIAIPGATALCYSLVNAQLSDSGATFSATATSAGVGVAVSTTATITVTSVITGYFTYSPTTDFYPVLLTSSDPFSYPTSFSITHNTPIPITLPPAMPANQYMLAKIPIGESTKVTWFNTPLNNGTIPDTVFESIVQFGGFTYYASRGQISMDVTQTLVLS